MRRAAMGPVLRMLVAATLLANLSPAHAQWTLLGYILGDNDLECSAVPNMQDMAKGLLTALPGSIDVMLNVDRRVGQCGWDPVDLPTSAWTTDRDISLSPGGTWSVLADYGEINQATASALAAFVKRALAKYPPSASRKYMMLIWDHGAGYKGSGEDMTCSATASLSSGASTKMCGWLVLDAILAGLKSGMATVGLEQFDILAFDACLMGNWEVAATLSPVASHLLFSEQLIPASGLNYTSLGFMATSPMPETPAVLQRWARDYIVSCSAGWGMGCCMSAVATANVAALSAALSNLASQWQADVARSTDLAVVPVKAGLLAQRVTKSLDEVVDLGNFITQAVSALISSAGSVAAASQQQPATYQALLAVQAALAQVFVVNLAANAPRMSGLSLYWPRSTTQASDSSPFLSPLATLSQPITQWISLVGSIQSVAQSLSTPYHTVLEAAAPFLTSVAWNGSVLDDTGSMIVTGIVPDASLDSGTSAGAPMRVLRAIPATVAGNARSIQGTWDGKLFGLSQQIKDAQGRVLAPTATGPIYTEESLTYDVSGALASRTLQAMVAYAPSCDSTVHNFQSATLHITTTFASNGTAVDTTFSLFSSSTDGDFGSAGSAGQASDSSSDLEDEVNVDATTSYLVASSIVNLGFLPKTAQLDLQDLLASQPRTRRSLLRSPRLRRQKGSRSVPDWANGIPHAHTGNTQDPTTHWAARNGAALRAALRTAAMQRARHTSRPAASGSGGLGVRSTRNLLSGDATTLAAGVTDVLLTQELSGSVTGHLPSDDVMPMKGPASLSQYFSSSSEGVSEVDPSSGGVIIPVFFTAYPLPSMSKQGRDFAYVRSFVESACFKWGYADNLTLVQKRSSAWSGALGLGSDAAQAWAVRLTAVDLSGSVVQFEPVAGGVAGSGSDDFQYLRRTAAGCLCRPQWYVNTTAGVTQTVEGCLQLTGWPAPGCDVDPVSCPRDAVLGLSATHDVCVPLVTLAGCQCQNAWDPGNGILQGTCAPRDALHPLASWCMVNTTTCPSASIRAQSSADTSWDYCADRTTHGCECANAWADANGVIHNGACAVQQDPFTNATVSWCPTNRDTVAYTSPAGIITGQLCPVMRDTCTPPAPRLATTDNVASGAMMCDLPALVSAPSARVNQTSALALSPSQLVMHDCLTYDPASPGSASVAPWCWAGDNLERATCIAGTCAGPLLTVCPPATNSTADIAACFQQVCATQRRGSSFQASACPNDTTTSRTQASTTYTRMFSSRMSASNASSPWLALLGGSASGMSAGEYCAATYGYPCGAALMMYCTAVQRDPSTGDLGLNVTGATCAATCLSVAGLMWAKVLAAGPAVAVSKATCSDAEQVGRVLRRLFAWYDVECYAEPSNLFVQQLMAPAADPDVCWAANLQSQVLKGPTGVLSSLVPTVGLFGSSATPPVGAAQLENLEAAKQARLAQGVEAALAALDASNGGRAVLYNASLACQWLIVPADVTARFIRLRMYFLSTELLYDPVQVDTADFLSWDMSGDQDLGNLTMTKANGTRISAQLPGAGLQFVTSSGGMLVSFDSDLSIQGLGFLATYETASTPFLDVPACSEGTRLVTLFFTGLAGIQQASWAVVSEGAACPNPGVSVSKAGLSTQAQAITTTVFATGGPAPRQDVGSVGPLVADLFPATASLMHPFEQATAFACLAPGSYKLIRFDSVGLGAWAPASAGAAVTEGVILAMTDTASNGNGTQNTDKSDNPVYEICDGFSVPSRRVGSGPDVAAARPTGAFNFTYTLRLMGLSIATLNQTYSRVRLATAIAKSSSAPLEAVSVTNATAVTELAQRRRALLVQQAPGPDDQVPVEQVLHPMRHKYAPHGRHHRWQHKELELQHAMEAGNAATPASGPSVRRRLRASPTVTTGVELQIMVSGFFSESAMEASLRQFHGSVLDGVFLARLKAQGMTAVNATVSLTNPYPDSKQLSTATLVGIVIGAICLIVGLALVVFYGVHHLKRRDLGMQRDEPSERADADLPGPPEVQPQYPPPDASDAVSDQPRPPPSNGPQNKPEDDKDEPAGHAEYETPGNGMRNGMIAAELDTELNVPYASRLDD